MGPCVNVWGSELVKEKSFCQRSWVECVFLQKIPFQGILRNFIHLDKLSGEIVRL
jgi:hypothetical protein